MLILKTGKNGEITEFILGQVYQKKQKSMGRFSDNYFY